MSPELAALVARFVDPDPQGPKMKVRAECARIGVSTTCFYKYVTRFRLEGVAGFTPRSRAPSSSPARVGAGVEDLVVRGRKELGEEGWDAGADSIRFWLELLITQDPGQWPAGAGFPARATVNRILKRRGQVVAVPQRKPRAATRRFQATHPNSCWQMDGFDYPLVGQVGTAPVVVAMAVVLHIIDDCTRYEIALRAMRSENAVEVWAGWSRAADRYGPPAWMLTDNGTAFSGRRRGWTSHLEENLTALGVGHITSSVGHPQTCGKCERAHQPVKQWLDAHGPYQSLEELQAGLDSYRAAHNQRPRQHLDGLSPAQLYMLGPLDGPADRIDQPLVISQAPVAPNGTIKLNGTSVGIGRCLADTHVTVFRQGTHTAVFAGNQLVAEFELKNRAGYQNQPTRGDAEHDKVSAMSRDISVREVPRHNRALERSLRHTTLRWLRAPTVASVGRAERAGRN